MQAVILAAGRGTRMQELTLTCPKPLLIYKELPLIEHTIRALPESIQEVIIIVGYKGEQIKAHFGESYNGKRITYCKQEELNGTAGALWCAKDLLDDRFLVLMGDDQYGEEDLRRSAVLYDWHMGVAPSTEEPSSCVSVSSDNRILALNADPEEGRCYAHTGMLLLDTRIFNHALIHKEEGSGEYGLPHTVLVASKEAGIPLIAFEMHTWTQISRPEDLIC